MKHIKLPAALLAIFILFHFWLCYKFISIIKMLDVGCPITSSEKFMTESSEKHKNVPKQMMKESIFIE